MAFSKRWFFYIIIYDIYPLQRLRNSRLPMLLITLREQGILSVESTCFIVPEAFYFHTVIFSVTFTQCYTFIAIWSNNAKHIKQAFSEAEERFPLKLNEWKNIIHVHFLKISDHTKHFTDVHINWNCSALYWLLFIWNTNSFEIIVMT